MIFQRSKLKNGKSPAKPRYICGAVLRAFPFQYSFEPGAFNPSIRRSNDFKAAEFPPESGSEVSELEEKLSRKINTRTTKYSAVRAQSVYP